MNPESEPCCETCRHWVPMMWVSAPRLAPYGNCTLAQTYLAIGYTRRATAQQLQLYPLPAAYGGTMHYDSCGQGYARRD